jgi:TolB-like protein
MSRWEGVAAIVERGRGIQYLFGDYALDLDRRELRRGSEAVPTGPQVFDVLVYLVQNRERVVSKDDLLEAVWNGRVVSESTLTSHINAARKAVGDSGEEQKLIRTVARKGFRFVGEVTEPPGAGGSKSTARPEADGTRPMPGLTLPDKPSIAVLPFQNLSGDPEQEYFADGVVEDIITALSRMRWLFVIARNSSFIYKGRAVDVKQAGRELGVRYIVEGGVRRAANRVRITAQLIDATTGASIWADRFDGGIEDIFELQDRMSESIVGAIAPTLEQAEIARAYRKPTESLDAYDFFLRGMANFHQQTPDTIGEALALFRQAIGIDPNYAAAYALAAWCHVWAKVNAQMTDRAREVAEGGRLARRATELGRNDAVALAWGGHALALLQGDFDNGIAFLDRARALNPNLAAAWSLSGFLRMFGGEDVAIAHFAHAMRLSPFDPQIFRVHAGTAFVHLFAGRLEDASSWAEKALRDQPNFLAAVGISAASNALAGRMNEAREAMQRFRRIAPTLRASDVGEWLPIRRPEDLARLSDGLRKAGLPE